jgi:hypothetical protein
MSGEAGMAMAMPDITVCCRPIITRAMAIASGQKRYYVGRTCPHGHTDEQYTNNYACIPCQAQHSARFRVENPDSVHASQSRYDRSAKGKAKKIEYYKSEAGRDAKSRYNTSDKGRETNRRCYVKSPEKFHARAARFYNANLELFNVYSRNRRSRKKSAEGFHTASDITAIRLLQRNKCAYCRRPLKGRGHIDHIICLKSGGSNWPRNLQLLCAPCNLSKGDKHPVLFAQRKGLLL